MTATDELRRLLNERSIDALRRMFEERGRDTVLAFGKPNERIALRVDGCDAEILIDNMAERFNRFAVCNLTPEQAVEATLGRGTCRECAGMEDVFECSECGMRYEGWALKRWARYCPNCGRKVVDA